jgi:hypothetical protein
MKRDNSKSAAARKPWFAALLGFAAGVLGGAGYLLCGREYLFNIPRLASIICYPQFFAGFRACDHWHHSEVVPKSTGVLAVGLAYALMTALARWNCITVCCGILSWKKLLLILPLLLCLTGCLVPRKNSALSSSAQPLTRTALLPVESPFEYQKKDIPREKVLRIGNAVLETLAKAKGGNLMGPAEVESLLGRNGIPVCLRWETEAKDIGAGLNASLAARQVASQLGVNQVVRCRIFPPTSSTSLIPATYLDDLHHPGWIGTHWAGEIYVQMQLINLDTMNVVQSSSAWGRAEQTIGLFLIFPAGYGTTFGRAFDHAERTALTELFRPAHPDSNHPRSVK